MGGSPFNALVASRYADFVRRVLGEDIRFDSVAPELMPVLEVGVLDRSEWLYPQGVRLWTTGPISIAAAVGNRSKLEVPNVSQNLIIVVTRAGILAPVAGQHWLTMDGPAQGTPTQNFAQDTRISGLTVQSINRIGNAAGGVGGNKVDGIFAAAGSDKEFVHALPLIITPGHNAQIWCDTVNSALLAIMAGYEFSALPQELAP